MQYSHSFEKATEFAALAIDRMSREVLVPTPEVYELWYVYFSGSSPEITRAIDILTSSKQKITNERCRELHQRFLGNSRESEQVRKAGDKIKTTIETVSGAVSSVRTAATDYGHKLKDITGKLDGNGGVPENVRGVLNQVVEDTNQMMEQNRALEVELNKSVQVMSELQRDLELVRKEALTDALTGIANRKAFDNELRRIAAETAEDGTFSLVIMDIDYFKSFNDNFGHQVGDQVLRLVARTLIEGVKGRDVAARYGGEEFMIILPETPLQAAVKVADVLRKAVATKDVVNRNTGEKMGRITLSAGASQYVHGESLEDLIERADAALYTAKHNGRNQVAAAPTPARRKS